MNSKHLFYPESRFGGFTDIDGTVIFFTRVNALLEPGHVVLDVGCGRGSAAEDPVRTRRTLRNLKGKAARVIGIDVDPAATENPFLDEFRLIEGPAWPLPDDSIDLMVCDYVLEHLEDPGQFFSEVRRVLKDGGHLCLRTPNRWGYVALAASVIPNRHHSKVTSRVQDGRKEEDVFPTLYRCNSRGTIRRRMLEAGFDAVVYGYESEPNYLAFSRVAYFLGTLHQKFAPGFLKPTLFAFGKISKK
jgi:SAM-dependent methyltransferase